jgi:5-methylcytosine-specific restriction endonuclease McrA
MNGMTKKAERELRREVVNDLASRKLKTKVRGIWRGHMVKAEKLKMVPPNYDADALIRHVEPVIGTPCTYCGKKITIGNFALDHGFPLNRGGLFVLENTYVITSPCNQKKGSLTVDEYGQLLQFLSAWPDAARIDILERLGVGGRWRRQ